MKIDPSTLAFWGCVGDAGHKLFNPALNEISYTPLGRVLSNLDGALPPQFDRTPYRAALSRLGGHGVSALAFWDYTVDTRPGSNAVIFAPSMTISAASLLLGLERFFPTVWQRLPPIVLFMASVE